VPSYVVNLGNFIGLRQTEALYLLLINKTAPEN